ncbi:MAG: hypothetical protein P8M49_10075 [Thalassotalea sp.]|nr:hypothetical protein [Thalassotalea sp.]
MLVNRKKITFVVVVYNKSLKVPSLTLTTLLERQSKFDNINCVICNNGPLSIVSDFIKLKEDYPHLLFHEYLDNKPLAQLYNDVIKDYPAEHYVILDDDTEINLSYLEEVYNFEGDVLVPEIFSNGKKQYPAADKRAPYNKTGKVDSFILSIASGLVISDYLVNEFRQEFGNVFDERFAFYGVDLAFFYRLTDYKKFNVVVDSALYHSLSKFEVENKAVKAFRKKEQILSKIILLRHYKKQRKTTYLKYIEALSKAILFGLKEGDVQFIRSVFRAVKEGKHPRC